MFNNLWMDKFAEDLAQINMRDLRVATQILIGHAALNYHLSEVNRTVQPICPLYEAEETISHLLGQSSMFEKLWTKFFDTYYTTATDILVKNKLTRIMSFVRRTKQLDLLKHNNYNFFL